ncbi:MAG: hypothetical protein LDL33_07515 [Desulfomonile sp.]|nr:hypothetical protein [Desulfomonile sp.]
MKNIIAIGVVCLCLVSFGTAEAQYRAQIDQAWKRIQARQEKAYPPSKKIDVDTSKKGKQNNAPLWRTPDCWSW